MTPHETKVRWDAMTSAWPNWRSYRQILGLRGYQPPWEVMEWLCNFRTALLGGIESFERHIASGGLNIEVVGTCDCIADAGEPTTLRARFNGPNPRRDPLAWLHANHTAYNRAQMRLIEDTIGLEAFREILERDLTVEDNDQGPEWGNLLQKNYAQEILSRLPAS